MALAQFHEFFWDIAGVPSLPGGARWTIAYMLAVSHSPIATTDGSTVGAMQITPVPRGSHDITRMERIVKRIKANWHWIGQHVPERLWVLWMVVRLLLSRTYSKARVATRKVAQDTRISDVCRRDDVKQMQIPLFAGNVLCFPGEEVVRHTMAAYWANDLLWKDNKRLAAPQSRNLATELAYLAYKGRGR